MMVFPLLLAVLLGALLGTNSVYFHQLLYPSDHLPDRVVEAALKSIPPYSTSATPMYDVLLSEDPHIVSTRLIPGNSTSTQDIGTVRFEVISMQLFSLDDRPDCPAVENSFIREKTIIYEKIADDYWQYTEQPSIFHAEQYDAKCNFEDKMLSEQDVANILKQHPEWESVLRSTDLGSSQIGVINQALFDITSYNVIKRGDDIPQWSADWTPPAVRRAR